MKLIIPQFGEVLMRQKQFFWRYFEKVGSVLAVVFAALLTVIYLLLLNQTTQNSIDTLYMFLLEVLSELIPAMLIVSVSLGIFRYFVNVQKEDEQKILVTKIAGAVRGGESISESGLVKIHNKFPNDRLREELHGATHVRVLTTWISDPIQNIEVWQNCIKRRNCRVEILMLDPNSDFAKQRGIDLGFDEAFATSNIKDSISHLTNLVEHHQGKARENKFSVKLYPALPSLYFFICDDTAFVGFYWHMKRATYSPIFEFNQVSNTNIGRMLNGEFEKIYDSDSVIDVFEIESDPNSEV